jgi:hypothetical protein
MKAQCNLIFLLSVSYKILQGKAGEQHLVKIFSAYACLTQIETLPLLTYTKTSSYIFYNLFIVNLQYISSTQHYDIFT